MAEVNLHQVRKSFGTTEVVHAVDVHVADGEFCVLVGPSGCGKSTLLRMVAGLEEISGGEIHIGARLVNRLPPKSRDVAMVFQNYALYPHMTVFENIAFSLRLAHEAQAQVQARVGEAAQVLGLTPYLQRYPRQLSGGQRQRVAMGRAIVRKPQVFLFDEPLSNLDAALRVSMRSEIKALHQRLGTTSIYVTHDQIEAMTMADRIVVMNGGRVEQIGTPLELYDAPANRFVAGFIGSPTMNFLRGRLGADGTVELDDGARMRLPGAVGGRDSGAFDAAAVPALTAALPFAALPGGLPPAALPAGRPCLVGVRPEHLQPAAAGLRATVRLVEPTGADTQLLCRAGTHDVTVLLRERRDVRVGDTLHLAAARPHLFDPQTGERLAA